MKYSRATKSRMVKKMTGPNSVSGAALSRETGISEATLSRWLQQAGTLPEVATSKSNRPKAKSTRDWTAQQKVAAVMEAAGLSEVELGAFLRREGLHREQLEQWREFMTEAAAAAFDQASPRRRSGPSAEQKQIRQLERELHRKEKALAETAALLVLKKNYPGAGGLTLLDEKLLFV